MWTAFFLENLKFAINLFSALTFFGISWLYYDAWTQKGEEKEKIRAIGFLLVAISFIVASTQVESQLVQTTILAQLGWATGLIFAAIRIVGYALIIRSQIIDPLQPQPDISKFAGASILPTLTLGLMAILSVPLPILAGWISFLYFRRATTGLERHLKPVAIGFFLLALAEFVNLGSLFRSTTNVSLYKLVAPYGPLWIAKYILIIGTAFLLGKWIFGYLLKRFFTQLFMIFTTSILVIFLIVTLSFTALLLRNMQKGAYSRLGTDVRVLGYSIDTKKQQVLSDAQLIASNTSVLSSLQNRGSLNKVLENFLLSKEQSFLLAVDKNGIVLARGEDSEKYGDSLSGDLLIKKALSGEETTSVVAKDFFPAPQLSIRAAVPLKRGASVVGALLAGTTIDNAFVDGMKKATNLESSAYGGNVLSATTLTSSDGKTRAVGLKEEDKKIKSVVLGEGKDFVGATSIFNVPYFAGYLPLKDAEGKTVGMIFVGEPQIEILQTASESIQATFIVSALLLTFSIIPSYFISRFLSEQVAA